MNSKPYNLYRELRKSKKLTQKELADQLFLDQSTISKWESNKAVPDYPILIKLSSLYGVSIDSLLGRSNAPREPLVQGSFEEFKVELKRLGIDGDLQAQMDLLKKIKNLSAEQKQFLSGMIDMMLHGANKGE